MYKLEFTLKQHTPLIHFQHDQAGATLRATEVKPKLDFFLMKKLLQKPEIPDHKVRKEFYKIAITKLPDETIHPWKNWLVGKGRNEHIALDYKLKFHSQSESIYLIASHLSKKQQDAIGTKFKFIPDSSFFAEEEAIGDLFKKVNDNQILKQDYQVRLNAIEKIGVLSQIQSGNSNEVEGIITSSAKGLIEELNNCLISFFIETNFGNRQNKGFGSFSIISIDHQKQENNYDNIIPRPAYKYKHSINDLGILFSTINSEYKKLKAKLNESDLRDYFQDEYSIGWEKIVILKHVNRKPYNVENFSYVRSYLGLAELYDFRQNRPEFKTKVKHLTKNKEEEIARFQSPLTFKYLDGNLYLFYKEVPEILKGQRFEFKFEGINTPPLVLRVPSIDGNFIHNFLKQKLNQNNWRILS